MHSALKGKLAVGALAVVLVSCGGGAGSGGNPAGTGGGSPGTGKATASGEATTGASAGASGGNDGSSSAATTTANSSSDKSIETVVIKETEFKLSPSTITLNKPGTYAFKAENEGSAEHNLRIVGEGVKSEGGQAGEAELERNLDPGESGVLRVTFRKPGTYEMYCPVIGHRLAGMKGKVMVK